MGRPKLFESVDEFIELSDAYFEKNEGGVISWTGLCLAVGAASRQSLNRYKYGEHGKEFVVPIKRALMVVENYYEETAEGAKSIFVLKNFDWKDRTEVETRNTHNFSNMTDEEVKDYRNQLKTRLDDSNR